MSTAILERPTTVTDVAGSLQDEIAEQQRCTVLNGLTIIPSWSSAACATSKQDLDLLPTATV